MSNIDDSAWPRIVNLTPHPVTIRNDRGERTWPSEGLARIETFAEASHSIGPVDVVTVSYGTVYGLPEPQDDVLYVVSQVLASALPERADLVFPYDLTRDDDGRVTGARALGRMRRRSYDSPLRADEYRARVDSGRTPEYQRIPPLQVEWNE